MDECRRADRPKAKCFPASGASRKSETLGAAPYKPTFFFSVPFLVKLHRLKERILVDCLRFPGVWNRVTPARTTSMKTCRDHASKAQIRPRTSSFRCRIPFPRTTRLRELPHWRRSGGCPGKRLDAQAFEHQAKKARMLIQGGGLIIDERKRRTDENRWDASTSGSSTALPLSGGFTLRGCPRNVVLRGRRASSTECDDKEP